MTGATSATTEGAAMPRKQINETPIEERTPVEERVPELTEVTTASAILGTERAVDERKRVEDARKLGETVRDVERRESAEAAATWDGPRYPQVEVERSRYTGNLLDFLSHAGRALRAEVNEAGIVRRFEHDVLASRTEADALERIGKWVTLR